MSIYPQDLMVNGERMKSSFSIRYGICNVTIVRLHIKVRSIRAFAFDDYPKGFGNFQAVPFLAAFEHFLFLDIFNSESIGIKEVDKWYKKY